VTFVILGSMGIADKETLHVIKQKDNNKKKLFLIVLSFSSFTLFSSIYDSEKLFSEKITLSHKHFLSLGG